jgi:hypothetical protein
VAIATGKDIMNTAVVEDTAIKDCSIKETLRWARLRQLMFLRAAAKKNGEIGAESKFDAMAKIVSNPQHFNLMLRMCIGNGDSITKSAEVSEEPKEKEDRPLKEGRK